MYVTLAGAGIVHLRKIKNMAIIILTTTSTHKSCSGSSADGALQNEALHIRSCTSMLETHKVDDIGHDLKDTKNN